METLAWFAIWIVSILSALYWYVSRKYRYWTDRGIVGPKPFPVVGNMLTLATESSVKYEMKWAQDYGKLYGTYIGFEPALTVMDPELIKQVMVRDFHLFVNHRKFNYFHEELSQNLFAIEGDRWKTVRSIVTPTFTSGKLRGMSPLMNRCVDKLNSHLDRLIDQGSNNGNEETFQTKQIMIGFTLDVIAATAFGTETNANHDDLKKENLFVKYALNFFNIGIFHTISLVAFPRWLNDLTNVKLDVNPESYHFFVSFLKEILTQRKANPTLKRNDLVQLLLDAAVDEKELAASGFSNLSASAERDDDLSEQNDVNNNQNGSNKSSSTGQRKLTENEIVAQCIAFFMAGYEPTASAIAFVLYELAINPDVQDRLVEELIDKLKDFPESKRNSNEFYEKVIYEIPYLDAIIKEILRKYPPVARVERRVSVDGYKLGPVELYKDQLVEVPVYAIHHSEEYYPEPERFNPDRFMPENKHLLVPYTYMPFGTGPRNCIGMRFAYQVVKLCLAQIVPRFRFKPTPETPIPLEFQEGQFFLIPVSMPVAVSKRS